MSSESTTAVVSALVEASAARRQPGASAVVEVTNGKHPLAVVELVDGAVVGASDAAADVSVPLAPPALAPWRAGEVDLAVAFMRGDCKPTGSTRALMWALDLLDDAAVRSALGAALDDQLS